MFVQGKKANIYAMLEDRCNKQEKEEEEEAVHKLILVTFDLLSHNEYNNTEKSQKFWFVV